jgi:hypothetical protein
MEPIEMIKFNVFFLHHGVRVRYARVQPFDNRSEASVTADAIGKLGFPAWVEIDPACVVVTDEESAS